MSVINFEHEFERFVFRGNKDDIWAIYNQNADDCRCEPYCVDEQNWEIELYTQYDDVEELICAYPLVKAAGFVLNWNEKTVYVAYSESGSTKIDKIHEVAHFDGHSEPDSRWYYDCPIVTERYSCKEYYSNAGGYDRFLYDFPYLTRWNNGRYSTHLLSDDDLAFSISSDGVLLECDSKEAVIEVPNGVKSIDSYAFVERSCIGRNTTLIEVILPESLQEISEHAFGRCYNLTTIHLPQGLETIGDSAFSYTKIEKLSIPVGLKNLSGHSFFLSEISQFQVSEDHPVFCVKDNCLYNKATRKLIRYSGDKTSVLIPEGIEEIDNHAFRDCNITEVIMPESLRRIGDDAFEGCRNLKNIHIPKNVTEIGYGAFEFCSALESIVLPDALTQIDNSTFSYCHALKQLTIPENVTRIDCLSFSGCDALEDIFIPASVTIIDNIDYLKATPWFQKQRNASMIVAGSVLLQYKKKDKHVLIPEGIKTIAQSVFSGKKLESIDLPNTLERIESRAFLNCTNLSSVVCPDSVTTIDWGAFMGCSALEYLYAVNAGANANCTPVGDGKTVSESMVAVIPQINISEQKGTAWKLALCRGFVLHPELVPETVYATNLAVVLKQRKKILAWAYANDNDQVVKFFIDQTAPTKAKLKTEYIVPAQEAGAKKCMKYISSLKV